jgi:FkbM family methyltransferase
MNFESKSQGNRWMFLFRNIGLLFPNIYKRYQNGNLTFVDSLFRRTHEPEYLALLDLLPESTNLSSIVDIGGNRGQSAKVFCRIFRPQKVYIFEPLEEMAQECKKVLRASSVEISVYEVALGASESRHQIFIPSYKSVIFWGLTSHSPSHAENFFNHDNVWCYSPGKLTISSREVLVKSLDSYHLVVDFIKIDVEGLEVSVLHGARDTIAMSRPIVLVEVSRAFGEINDFFGPLDYVNLELHDTSWELSQGRRLNQLFLPREIHRSLFLS